jgi:hypothetical protein
MDRAGFYLHALPVDETTHKRCPHCGQELPVAEFNRNAARHDGLNGYCRTCQNAASKASEAVLRLRAIETLGGRCVRCELADVRVLVIDHVEGRGREQRDAGERGNRLYRAVVAEGPASGRFQALCHNCNFLKRIELGEHVGDREYVRVAAESRTRTGRGTHMRSPEHAARLRALHADPVWQAARSAKISATRRARSSGATPTGQGP